MTSSGQRLLQPAPHLLGPLIVGAAEDQRELVAAPAEEDVGLAHLFAQRVGDAAQALVAPRGAPDVVDALEVHDVEHQHRKRDLEPRRAVDLRVEALIEGAAVRQSGEAVEAGLDLRCLGGVLELKPAAADRAHQRRRDEREAAPGDEVDQGLGDVLVVGRVVDQRGEHRHRNERHEGRGPSRGMDRRHVEDQQEHDRLIGRLESARAPLQQGEAEDADVGGGELRVPGRLEAL